MLTDYHNSFSDRLTRKFAIVTLNIPSHIKHIATLPCENSAFQKLPCSRTECSKLWRKTQPLKNVEKYLLA